MDKLILVNKQNALPQVYVPRNLVQDPATRIWLTRESYQGFCKMNHAIQKAALSPLILVSGYRPYDYQQKLFNRKVKNLMEEESLDQSKAIQKAATIVARPGTSEHQTGLAIDVTSGQLAKKQDPLIELFGETDHGKWLDLKAEDFGFILRYPRDKTHITQITYEPWHYRYVGIRHAKKIKASGMCLEEYITAGGK